MCLWWFHNPMSYDVLWNYSNSTSNILVTSILLLCVCHDSGVWSPWPKDLKLSGSNWPGQPAQSPTSDHHLKVRTWPAFYPCEGSNHQFGVVLVTRASTQYLHASAEQMIFIVQSSESCCWNVSKCSQAISSAIITQSLIIHVQLNDYGPWSNHVESSSCIYFVILFPRSGAATGSVRLDSRALRRQRCRVHSHTRFNQKPHNSPWFPLSARAPGTWPWTHFGL